MITLCTIEKIEATTVMFGFKYQGPIDAEGNELGSFAEGCTEVDKRWYVCRNCGEIWDGTVSFDECREHLGGVIERSALPKAQALTAQPLL